MLPTASFRDQRHGIGPPTAEKNGRNGHAFGVFPLTRDAGGLRSRHGEASIGMGGRLAGIGIPSFATPIGETFRRLFGERFPPHILCPGFALRVGHIREEAVARQRGQSIRVGLLRSAWGDSEKSGLGVDGVKLPVIAEAHPSDVVAHGLYFPARQARHHHRHIRLAASRREGCGDVFLFAAGRRDAQDQHVLGHPAVVPCHSRGDPQSEALLAQQSIASVARPVRPDLAGFGEMRDAAMVGVARPCHICFAIGQRMPQRMNARHEAAVAAHEFQHLLAHAGHYSHVHHHIRRVGDLNPVLGNRRPQRPHAKRNHIHRAPGHRPAEMLQQLFLQFLRVAPVVRGAGVFLAGSGYESLLFHTGHIARIGEGQIAVGPLLVAELAKGARSHHLIAKLPVFLFAAVAPAYARRLENVAPLLHPGYEAAVAGGRSSAGSMGVGVVCDGIGGRH